MASSEGGAGFAVLSLGSNVSGDTPSPAHQVARALRLLGEHPQVELAEASRLFATPPWGGVSQEEFRNATISVETTLSPLALLHHCQGIERAADRRREVRWGPRTLDVDILAFFNDAHEPIVSAGQWGEELILPHPYAHQRAFVLVPWMDLPSAREPWCILPTETESKTVAQWLEAVDPAEVAGVVPAADGVWGSGVASL
ncbi:2-amino-4-hydroxy-6-hydroxymethyldihydropteridine diphosphokinase [Corynebacterium resistens]|uniref:2-amino-4-hydroxy-6- hydroxymethyldihydropteridine diphosphokinase n=1 Tax=Corynebacterium resistens TaxID=258224 RepID=UPI00235507CF|nr:2-amino-4-hydroxy-6-hydroxymethyldihydropteridine diphosphokinase [Corynebacterium resistens]